MLIGRDGKTEWIAGGFQNQYGMEVNVVAVICKKSPLLLLPVFDVFCRWLPFVRFLGVNLNHTADHQCMETKVYDLFLVRYNNNRLLCPSLFLPSEESK